MYNCGSHEAFMDNQPKHSQLWALPQLVPKLNANARCGIYCILYRIKSDNSRVAWYVGKSRDMERRIYDHRTQIQGTQELLHSRRHYGIARQFFRHRDGEWKAVVLAEFRSSAQGPFLRCAEQMFQCALHAYNPAIFAAVQAEEQTEFIGRAIHYQAAQTVSELTKTVAQAIGWNLDPSVVGCGWSTAMTEVTQMPGEMLSWLRHDLLNSRGEVAMHRFMRPSRGIERHTAQSNTVPILKRRVTSCSFQISVDPRWGIPDNSRVNVIVEIAPKGTDHHTPYMRYPKFGPFTDWDIAASLAIRLEWEVSGTWKAVYVQQDRLFIPSVSARGKPEEKHLFHAYVSASELLESLLRFRYKGKLPSWKNDQPRDLFIRQVQYNHMEQRMDIRTPPVLDREMPRMRSPTEVRQMLVQHYGKDLIVGQLPPNLFRQRLNCDVCFMLVSSLLKLPALPALTHAARLRWNGLLC